MLQEISRNFIAFQSKVVLRQLSPFYLPYIFQIYVHTAELLESDDLQARTKYYMLAFN